jgi:hypothetical protein
MVERVLSLQEANLTDRAPVGSQVLYCNGLHGADQQSLISLLRAQCHHQGS